jgi:sugar lactone lactonase YvrE
MRSDLPSPENADLAVNAHCALAEGPVWFRDRLWWVDIHGQAVHECDVMPGTHVKHDMGRRVTVVVPTEDNRIAFCGDTGIHVAETPGDSGKLIAEFPADSSRVRFNDGKCDGRGRLWIGTMGLKAESGMGTLYRFDPRQDGATLTTRVPHVTISNGLAWSGDGRTMYYIDTPTRRIDAFSYDIGNGEISDRRPIFTVPEGAGNPDGMCIDAEDKLWVALWGGWSVLRIDPATGKMLQRIALPVEQVSSCCFGGDNLSTLYITTAGGTNPAKKASEPLAGGIFRFNTGTRGLPCATLGIA